MNKTDFLERWLSGLRQRPAKIVCGLQNSSEVRILPFSAKSLIDKGHYRRERIGTTMEINGKRIVIEGKVTADRQARTRVVRRCRGSGNSRRCASQERKQSGYSDLFATFAGSRA